MASAGRGRRRVYRRRIADLVRPELPALAASATVWASLALKSYRPNCPLAPFHRSSTRTDVDLTAFPACRVAGTAGFPNYGLTHTRHPETASATSALPARSTPQHAGYHCNPQTPRPTSRGRAPGRRLPVAVAVGCDPVGRTPRRLLAPTSRVPFAGFLLAIGGMVTASPRPACRCRRPRDRAEGYVEPGAARRGTVRRHTSSHAGRAVPGLPSIHDYPARPVYHSSDVESAAGGRAIADATRAIFLR